MPGPAHKLQPIRIVRSDPDFTDPLAQIKLSKVLRIYTDIRTDEVALDTARNDLSVKGMTAPDHDIPRPMPQG